MRVLYALICEHAAAREDGRLDAQGIFFQLFAPGFPARQDHLMLAVELEWTAGEAGRQPLRIDLLDPGGSPVFTISGHSEVGEHRPGEPPLRTQLVMPLEGVVFPTSGTFEFALHAAGEHFPLAPLHLIEHPDAR